MTVNHRTEVRDPFYTLYCEYSSPADMAGNMFLVLFRVDRDTLGAAHDKLYNLSYTVSIQCKFGIGCPRRTHRFVLSHNLHHCDVAGVPSSVCPAASPSRRCSSRKAGRRRSRASRNSCSSLAMAAFTTASSVALVAMFQWRVDSLRLMVLLVPRELSGAFSNMSTDGIGKYILTHLRVFVVDTCGGRRGRGRELVVGE